MNQKKFFLPLNLIIAILFPILISSSAKGETIPVKEKLINSETLLTQSESSSPVVITGIQVNSTGNGIEIILNNSSSENFEPITTTEGNNLIINISNAQLKLPEGEEFTQENPTQDIASIRVINLESNTIRITITGVKEIPTAEVSNSLSGLVITLTPPTPTLEILVTAQKQPENAQNVPISLTPITQKEIQDADITSLSGISANTPNFTTFTPNRNFIIYSMRGLSNFNFLSRDPVAFYVDDVPYDYTGFLDLDLPDIERVEVLRGPQATLYGRNAQAGVVNIITRKPTNVPELIGSFSYANYNNPNLRASFSAPLVEDKLSFRLSGSYQRRDGYLFNSFSNTDVDYQSGKTGRVQLLWTPSEDWEILFNGGIDNYNGGVPLNLLGDDPFRVTQDFDGFNNLTSDNQSVKVAYNHQNFRFTSITARRFSDQQFEGDTDISTADILRQVIDLNSKVISQEIRFQSPKNAKTFEWLLGGYFESRDFNIGSDGFRFGADSAIFGFTPGLNQVSGEVSDTILAFFAQGSYRPIESLTLTAGLRYESFNSNLNNRQRLFIPLDGSPSFATGEFNNIEKNGDIVLPRFIAQYNFNPNVMMYGSITRGYKPPGINYRADTIQFLTYEAEKSWNYEMGFKSSWLDNKLFVNLAVFYNKIDDFQIPVPDFTGFFRDVANGEVSITGAEIEVRATPVTGFDIIAGFGVTDATFDNYTNPFTGQNLSGNTLAYAPDFTYNLALQYRSPGGFFSRLELQGVGTTFFDDANVYKQGSFALLNARIGYEIENSGIYLFANNITDVRNLITAAAFPPFGTFVTYGAPLTYGIQFRQRF